MDTESSPENFVVGGKTKDSSLVTVSYFVPMIRYYLHDGTIKWTKYYLTDENEVTALRIQGTLIYAILGSPSYKFYILIASLTDGSIS